jgi:hypothetical protein
MSPLGECRAENSSCALSSRRVAFKFVGESRVKVSRLIGGRLSHSLDSSHRKFLLPECSESQLLSTIFWVEAAEVVAMHVCFSVPG